MFSSLMSKENLSSKRRKSLVNLGENCGKNTEIAVEEYDPPSSRKSLRLQGPSGISLSPEILKTSEYSSENFGKTPGDDHTAKAKTKREREKGQAKTKYIGTEETDVNSNMEFPSHSQDELRKIYGERTQRDAKFTLDSEELESSEEEEGISEDELKNTKGWMLLMKALDSKFEKKH